MTTELASHTPEAAVDIEEALDRLGGDQALLVELTGIFLEDSKDTMDAMRTAVEHRRAEELMQAAHKAKGGLGVLGCHNALRLAEALETLGGKREITAARKALPLFETELDRVRETLAKFAATV